MWSLQLQNIPYEADLRELLMAFYPELDSDVADGPEVTGKVSSDGRSYLLEMHFPSGEIRKLCCPVLTDRFATKCELKRHVYRALAMQEGRELPWGTLTGIRPTKLILNDLEAHSGDPEYTVGAKRRFREAFLTGKAKTDLCFATAAREAEVLRRFDYRSGWSLYVGIPFCPTRCLYCSFPAYPIELWRAGRKDYLRALKKEIRAVFLQMQKENPAAGPDTVYIGGGTPTSLEADELQDLIAWIHECSDGRELLEFTVEAGRPDSITGEKLRVLKAGKVTRISINPQTMNQKTLDLIGRRHTVAQVEESFRLARSLGFDNINMDLIAGLPEEGIREFTHTMDVLEALAPDDITVHSLALKRASRLSEEKEHYRSAGADVIREMTELAAQRCKAMSLEPYYLYRQKNIAGNFENVGYCKAGHEGIYNILIMEERQRILGCGAGTTTKLPLNGGLDGVKRIENVKDPQLYIDRIDEMIARKKDIAQWH